MAKKANKATATEVLLLEDVPAADQERLEELLALHRMKGERGQRLQQELEAVNQELAALDGRVGAALEGVAKRAGVDVDAYQLEVTGAGIIARPSGGNV